MAKRKSRKGKQPTAPADMQAAGLERDRLRRMVEEILPHARERAQLLGEMRAALLRGEDVTAMARRLCGLPPMFPNG